MKNQESYNGQEKTGEIYPDCREKSDAEKNCRPKKWDIKGRQGYALYEWWLRKVGEVKGDYGYNFLVCMAIYACKCDVPREKLAEDMHAILEKLSLLSYNDRLTEEDVQRALETYDQGYYRCTIAEIEKLSGIQIKRSKRNHQKQCDHLEKARAIRDIHMRRQNRNWWDGNGRPSVENIVREYMANNPDARKADVIRGTGLSKPTVYKYYDKARQEVQFGANIKS